MEAVLHRLGDFSDVGRRERRVGVVCVGWGGVSRVDGVCRDTLDRVCFGLGEGRAHGGCEEDEVALVCGLHDDGGGRIECFLKEWKFA